MALVVCALIAFAAEPWNQKTPDQWDKKDVDKILRDSPWTKPIAVPTTWARTGGEKFEVGGPIVSVSKGRGPLNRHPTTDPEDPQNYHGYFLLRWASSNMIRRALQREAVLQGKPSHPHISRALTAEKTELYELDLVWDLFARFPTATEIEVANNSYLKPGRLGVEFKPKSVEFHQPPGGVTWVVFFFEKKTSAGEPIVTPDEDRVDFYWRIGPSGIQARFAPSKMVARGVQDF